MKGCNFIKYSNMTRRLIFIFANCICLPGFICCLLFPGEVQAQKSDHSFTRYLQPAVFSLSKVMMHDVVNPPAASRYYAYCMLGAYEIVSQHDTSLIALTGFIKQYNRYTIPTGKKEYDYRIAAIYCIMETGRLMLPSGFMLKEDE